MYLLYFYVVELPNAVFLSLKCKKYYWSTGLMGRALPQAQEFNAAGWGNGNMLTFFRKFMFTIV